MQQAQLLAQQHQFIQQQQMGMYPFPARVGKILKVVRQCGRGRGPISPSEVSIYRVRQSQACKPPFQQQSPLHPKLLPTLAFQAE
jgi:hypothetical protein